MAASDINDFTSKVSAWVKKSEARTLAVFKESTKTLVQIAQNGVPHIPVDTGFARASLRSSLSQMPQIDSANKRPQNSSVVADNATGEVMALIATVQLGQTIFIGWTANYVAELEKGHSQQAPNGFVRLAALQWTRIVRETCARLKQQVENG